MQRETSQRTFGTFTSSDTHRLLLQLVKESNFCRHTINYGYKRYFNKKQTERKSWC